MNAGATRKHLQMTALQPSVGMPREGVSPRPHGTIRTIPRQHIEPITVEAVENGAGLEALRNEWNPLLRDSGSNTLFLSSEWLFTWWKHLGKRYRLHALAIRRGPRLIALAPLALGPRDLRRLLPFRHLGFMGMGTVGSDYLNLIIRHGEEEAALDAISRRMARTGGAFEFRRVAAGATATANLAAKLQGYGWRVVEDSLAVCPLVRLHGHDWESYCASLGRSHRQNLRRRLRQVERNFSVNFEKARTESERQEYLGLFMKLHLKRWGGLHRSDAINSEAIIRFHEEFSRLALARGWLRLYILRLNERPAAAVYGFRYDDVFYYYQAGFDPEFRNYSIGLIALGLTIRRALGEGVRMCDLLHGPQRYKFLWANDSQKLARYRCYSPTLPGAVFRRTEQTRDRIKVLRHLGDDSQRGRTNKLL